MPAVHPEEVRFLPRSAVLNQPVGNGFHRFVFPIACVCGTVFNTGTTTDAQPDVGNHPTVHGDGCRRAYGGIGAADGADG
jgi:hypothetical protein